MGLLDRAGARLTARPEDAEILVVNTCSFIDTAKQESVDTILEMARHKTEGRAKKLIVAGCLVERYRDEIRKNIPEVDAVVGTGELESILEAAGPRARSPPRPRPSPSSPASSTPKRSEPRAQESQRRHAQDRERPEEPRRRRPSRARRAASAATTGRAHRICCPPISTTKTPRVCSPRRARRPTSKSPKAATIPAPSASFPTCAANSARDALNPSSPKPQQLVARGVEEITLIGQDTTCYGEDLGLKDGLATLLDELARIEGLRWLRFLYAYPNRITGRLLETIAQHDNICKYLDLPLQHASPDVLKRMKRGAGAEIFLKTLEKVRAAVPESRCAPASLSASPASRSATLRFWRSSSPRRNSTGSASSATPMKKAPARYALDAKVPKRTIESRRAAADEAAAVDLAPRQAAMGRPRADCCSPKAKARKPRCSGKAAPSSTRPRSTARSTSTTSASWKRSSPAASTAPRSPKPTTTTWSRASSLLRNKERRRSASIACKCWF